MGGPRGRGHDRCHLARHRPAAGPCHRHQGCLAAHHVPAGEAASGPRSQQHHPPRSVGCLDQVPVAGALDRGAGAAMAHDGVGRARLEGTPGRGPARDRGTVAPLRPAFGDEQVPVLADPVQVRRFGELGARRPGPQPARLTERLASRGINADLLDPGIGAPAAALLIPGQVRVESGDRGYRDRVRPRAGGVGGGEQHGAAMRGVPGDQPEPAIVVPKRRRVDATGRRRPFQGQLARPVQRVANLVPVHQVPAVKDRHAREVLETGAREVVILADAAHARIGMEARDHRVGERAASHPPAPAGASAAAAPVIPCDTFTKGPPLGASGAGPAALW